MSGERFVEKLEEIEARLFNLKNQVKDLETITTHAGYVLRNIKEYADDIESELKKYNK